jgi:uncharacterized DUF497 family protein
MLFAWDENKNLSNQRKHGISFKFASRVFEDPYVWTSLDDRYNYFEERWKSIGLINDMLIFVLYCVEECHEEEKIRIISAREASDNEARRYRINRGGSESGIKGIEKS